MIRHKDWTFYRATSTITKNGVELPLRAYNHPKRRPSRRFSAIEHLVLSDGRATRESMAFVLYGDREDGGPLDIRNMVDVLLAQMLPTLARINMKLVRDRRAGTTYFSVQDVVRPAT